MAEFLYNKCYMLYIEVTTETYRIYFNNNCLIRFVYLLLLLYINMGLVNEFVSSGLCLHESKKKIENHIYIYRNPPK